MEARLTEIDRRETLQYLRYRGSGIPRELLSEIGRCEQTILAEARPRAVWKLFELREDGQFAETGFCPAGEDIRRHLQGCDRAILMAATLGVEVERLLRRMQTRDAGEALILDAASSAAIENVCDNLCADLAKALAPAYLTTRFSPGYGDLSLAQQGELFQALDVTRRIGVSLTESNLMVPQKSVTAIIGVSDTPRHAQERRCSECNLYKKCEYRREGVRCGE